MNYKNTNSDTNKIRKTIHEENEFKKETIGQKQWNPSTEKYNNWAEEFNRELQKQIQPCRRVGDQEDGTYGAQWKEIIFALWKFQKEKKKKGRENIIKATMAENSPNLGREKDIQV